MANYTITFSCGHCETRQMYGPVAQRERYVAWAADQGQCKACQAADKADEVKAVEDEAGLPEMTGSVKQIAWARKIRAEKVGEIVTYIDTMRAKVPADKTEIYEQRVALVMTGLAGKTSASWWIDSRDMGRDRLMQVAFEAAQ